MDKLLKLAQQAGMSEEQGKTAAGGIFGLLKNQLSEADYAKLTSQFPEADSLATQQKKDGGASDAGGLLGAAMGALGGGSQGGTASSSGGGATDITSLLAMLAGKGVTPQQIQKFLPLAAPHIQKMTGIDVSSMLGAPAGGGTAAGAGGSTSTGGGASNAMNMLNSLTGSGSGGSDAANSNPLGSAMGMFGK
jgi:hypothetical protein